MSCAVVFLAFPPGSGGNHLRNMLLASSDFFDNTADNIEQKYSSHDITVHCNDTGSDIRKENLTFIKLETALDASEKNYLFYGHFAEIFSFRNIIQQFQNKKFICISIKSDNCKNLLNQRKKTINTPELDAYHIGEQTFLYESLIYQKIYDVAEDCVMDISISEFFSTDLTCVIELLENFLQIKLDINKINCLHRTWLEKNFLLTTNI